jgi:RimJ/RimL family protein N-acetyltransferase
VTLTGSLCSLRPWTTSRSDAASLVRHADNADVARQLRDRFPHPYRLEDARAFLKNVSASDPPTNFAIVAVSNNDAIGGVGFVPGSDIERFSAEVGYWLGQDHWGRGIATEALQLVSAYAFDRLGLLRLFALPFADNAASIRVLEKAGFVREGTLRSSSVKFGQPRDQAMFALVNEHWTAPPPGHRR